MTRLQIAVGVLALSASVAGLALSLNPPVTRRGDGWDKVPAITVIAAAGDPRAPVVKEAVDYWNRTLEELGTPFRLGLITHVIGSVPDADLRAMSEQTLSGRWFRTPPADLERFPGDLLVVLSDASFISFTAPVGDRTLVAIKNGRLSPLSLPNVLRNVIAHELGHAIGLQHNADPAMLMCGRPADCRPDAFQSDRSRFFPLTEQDRTLLLRLYPQAWQDHNRDRQP